MAELLVEDGICDSLEHGRKVGAWVLRQFDLAPKGTLGAFVDAIAHEVRTHPGTPKD